MGDPFSLASSAMGVISLGLSVCQGLNTYYASYNSYSRVTNAALCQIHTLGEALQLVKTRLVEIQQLDDSLRPECDIAAAAIQQCKPNVLELQHILRECRKEAPGGKKQKAAQKLEHILFPLRRATLDGLLATMDRFQSQLNFALQSLNMAISVANGKNLALLLSRSGLAASDAGQVLDMVQDLESQQTLSSDRLSTIEQRLSDIEINIIRHGQNPIRQPSLLRSLLDEQRSVESDMEILVDEGIDYAVATRNPMQSRLQNGCPCPSCSRSNSIQAFQNYGMPGLGCSYSASKKSVISLQMRRTFCNFFLNFSIRASLEVTTGAGGFSISPHLDIYPVVSDSSPAFRLLSETENTIRGDNQEVLLQDALKNLAQLFQDGKASPLDALADGTSLLHVIARWNRQADDWNTASQSQWRSFIHSLLRMGLRPNQIDNNGQTPVDVLMLPSVLSDQPFSPVAMDIFSDILRARSQLLFEEFESRYLRNFINSLFLLGFLQVYSWTHCIDRVDIPEEFAPLIYQSEELLEQALSNGTDMKEAMIHYVQWPEGLSRLLQAGYVPNMEMLELAFHTEIEASIKLLVELNTLPLTRSQIRECSMSSYDQNISDFVIETLANRRQKLQALAEVHLTSKQLSQLGIRPGCLIGYNASKVCQMLRSRSIELDYPEDESSEWLIYSSIGQNLNVANKLWKAGFRDVDEVDSDGRTSLMHVEIGLDGPVALLKKAEWLINKGADPYRKTSHGLALHALAREFGESVAMDFSFDIQLISDQLTAGCRSLIRTILLDNTRDACCCSCSLDGCTSLSRFLNGMVSKLRSYSKWLSTVPQQLELINALINMAESESPGDLLERLAPVVLRSISFRALGLPHTCSCDGEVSPDDMKDIQSDYNDQILELEDILIEFPMEIGGHKTSLIPYIQKFWRDRVLEKLYHIPTRDDVSRIREVGVILCDS